MALRLSRLIPKLKSILTHCKHYDGIPTTSVAARSRNLYSGRRDPFSQMEAFMKDMESKFKDQFNYFDSVFKDLPRLFEPSSSLLPSGRHCHQGAFDMSSEDTFKLSFNFRSAKPDDINVTLKDRTLTVTAKLEESTDTTRFSQDVSYTYEIPDRVQIESLVSSLSEDGMLSVSAPMVSAKGPTTINIKRE